MIGQPLVSIITPVYNAEKYLAETVESVLAQTYEHFELLLVDDASRDTSRQIMKELAGRDRRIRTFFLDVNSGPSGARNRGVEASRGEFVAFLDADDLWAAHKLERQLAAFVDRPELGVVGTNGRIIDAQGRRQGRLFLTEHIRRGTFSMPEFLLNKIPLATSSVMVRRECLTRHGVFNETYRICEDYELWMRLLQYYELDIVDEELLYYRQHESNTTSNKIKNRHYKILVYENYVLKNITNYPKYSYVILSKLQKKYNSYGKILIKNGDFEKGIAFLDKAIILRKSMCVTFCAFAYKYFTVFRRRRSL